MASDPLSTPDPIRFGDHFELDIRAYELRRSGRAIKLERIPMELLILLIERRGELVTREQIIQGVWGNDVFLDTESGINAAIRKIRLVLKDDPERPRFVQTVTGKGYRFIATIQSPAPSPSLPSPVIGDRLPSAENLLGKKISHYRILQLLGGGGMGVVYKAEDLKLGRQVALKFLPTELARDPAAFQRLEQEARAASALDHPNICSIYHLGEDQGQPFIVMQLLEGQTLREWIPAMALRSPSQIKDMVNVAIQITDGLEAAHQKGIIHRDIKPANIFITGQGQAKILDFGVAKFMDEAGASEEKGVGQASGANMAATHLTQTGATVGTPSYLSPEQIRREKLDTRTDLFSFGLVLYEMATGKRAFSGNTVTVIRDAVLNVPIVPPRRLDSSFSPELERIITKSLEKDRDRRYQSAAELGTDLRRLNSPQPARLPARRVGVFVATGVILLAVALFATNVGGVRQRLFHRVPPSDSSVQVMVRPAIAVLGFKNLSGRDDEAWISTALSEMLGAELASGQQLRVIPGEDVARMKLDLALPSADSYGKETLSKIRNHLGTDMVVLGSYLATGKDAGGKIRMNLQLQDARAGETIAVVSRDGTESGLADLVSLSGASLRQKLGVADVSPVDGRQVLATVPTNLEAARFYAEGLARLQTFDALAARDFLEKAVAVDPNHALSHSALAQSWSALGYDTKALAEAKKAFELSTNVPREERLSIEGRYREFANDLPAAIEIYRTLSNFFPDNLDYGLRLVSAQIKSGLGKDALQTIARMRTIPKPTGGDARIDMGEASAAISLGDFNRAQQLSATAAARGLEQGSPLLVQQAKELEGRAWDRLGEMNMAEKRLSEARALGSTALSPRSAASAARTMGVILYHKGDFGGARESFEEALRIFRRIGTQLSVSLCLTDLGNLLYDQGKLEEAKQHYEDALRVDREIASAPDIASDLGNIANVLEGMGDLVGATRMQERSLQAFRDVGDKRGEASTLGNLGLVLLERGELTLAKQNYDRALAIMEEIGYKRGRGYVLQSVAEINLAQDQLEQARTIAQQGLALRRELGDSVRAAQSQTGLAKISLEQGSAAEAEAFARAAAPTFEQQKVADYATLCAAILVRSLLAQGRVGEAKVAADQALILSQRTSDRAARFMAAMAAAEVSARLGKTAEAIRSLETVRTEASHYGYTAPELEARLHLGEIEVRSGMAVVGRSHLDQLREDARTKGFLLVARKASLASNDPSRR
jgi:tetratricopeptide (TPR) repeat protein/DNA-binding winged helix-turn-helix (wHTH) protein/TolB-like protein/predicted Ser/Thr protein kinase